MNRPMMPSSQVRYLSGSHAVKLMCARFIFEVRLAFRPLSALSRELLHFARRQRTTSLCVECLRDFIIAANSVKQLCQMPLLRLKTKEASPATLHDPNNRFSVQYVFACH